MKFIRVLKANEETNRSFWLKEIKDSVKAVDPDYNIIENRDGFIKIIDEQNQAVEKYRIYDTVINNLQEKYPNAKFYIRDLGLPTRLVGNEIRDAQPDIYMVCLEY